MSQFLEQASADGLDEIIELRHRIHAHPELGFEETLTSALVAESLKSWGIDVTQGLGRNGVVGSIVGRIPGDRHIGLRADMDALALTETNELPYASKHAGKMHACGHDGHTAMLLGAARTLARERNFAGTVHVIFQPAEEGLGGALAMLDDGLFTRFPCERIYGMHSYPPLSVGQFGTRHGALMAASGRWQVEFSGSGGHGGMSPHLAADLTLVQAGFIQSLQALVAREVPPLETAIISVGYIHAGAPNAMNVMPSKLSVSGTMRAFSTDVQELLEARMVELAKAHAALVGAQVTTKLWWNTVPVVNDDIAVQVAIKSAQSVVGDNNVHRNHEPVTAGEDFAYMMRERPGAFIFIGNGPGGTHTGGGNLHMPNYDFNDTALPYGIAYWLAVVHEELGVDA